MTDWIGSLRMTERSAHRVVLAISRATRVWGWLLCVAGVALVAPAWSFDPWAAVVPAGIAAFGLVLATLERDLVVDQAAGVLRVDQRALWLGSSVRVPLFHVRAVIVTAQPARRGRTRYVAFIDRRVGEPIYLDEARRVARLMIIAEAIAEVAEVRLEYTAAG